MASAKILTFLKYVISGLYSKLFCGIGAKWPRISMSNRGPGLSHMWRISKSAELGSSFTGPIFERNTTVAAKGK